MVIFRKVIFSLFLCFLLLPRNSAAQLSSVANSEILKLLSSCKLNKSCDGHAQSAQNFNRSGNRQGAIEEFQQAYELVPYPPFLYNIARLHHQEKQWSKAVEYYKQYLNAKPSDDPAMFAKAQEYMAQAEHDNLVAQQTLITPSGPLELKHDTIPLSPARPKTPKPVIPVYKKWWFWTILGITAAGAVTAGVVVATWPRTPGDADRLQLNF